MGRNGEHIAAEVLRKLGYKAVEITIHKHPFDVLTSRTAWEVKTHGYDSAKQQMDVNTTQMKRKLAFAKKNRLKVKSVFININDKAEVFIRDGLGNFRRGAMKRVAVFDNWRNFPGYGRRGLRY